MIENLPPLPAATFLLLGLSIVCLCGRVEMSMLAHFTLNAIRFLLFTYPRAA